MNLMSRIAVGQLVPALVCLSLAYSNFGCTNSVRGSSAPAIVVNPSPTVGFIQLSPGQEAQETVVISNVGVAPLSIKRIAKRGDEAFDLLREDFPADFPTAPIKIDPGESFSFRVLYRQIDENDKVGELIIESNAPNNPKVVLRLESTKPRPRLDVTPNPIEFAGQTDPGSSATIKVLCKNIGNAPLRISKFSRQGSNSFSIVHPVGAVFSDLVDDGNPGPDPNALVLQPDEVYEIQIKFTPTDIGIESGKLRIFTNDDTLLNKIKDIPIVANSKGACLLAQPKQADFGSVKIGTTDSRTITLVSCGGEPIQIKSVSFKNGSSPDFSAKFDTADTNRDLNTNDGVTLTLTYTPGQPGKDDGVIVVETTREDNPRLEIPVIGNGTDKLCPIAKIEVVPGLAVEPQTTLLLKGDQSTGSDGNTQSVAKWRWEVVQPQGSASAFIPAATVPNPSFEANVAGDYTFRLRVFDKDGQESCEPAEVKVSVKPIRDIHVELVWKTPGDKNEFDDGPNAGTDLDLHFMSPLGSFFDLAHDVFWYNPAPDWGLQNPNFDDNPTLDRDDSDGAGPENLNFNNPQDVVYRVGVHYWRDPGAQSKLKKPYGNVKAIVRVYIRGVLALETEETVLKLKDFWEVATIDWKTRQVTLLRNPDNSLKIQNNYVPPIDLDALSN